jgi:hypothetical protein
MHGASRAALKRLAWLSRREHTTGPAGPATRALPARRADRSLLERGALGQDAPRRCTWPCANAGFRTENVLTIVQGVGACTNLVHHGLAGQHHCAMSGGCVARSPVSLVHGKALAIEAMALRSLWPVLYDVFVILPR